jgi:hypothetical protein
MLEIDVPPIAYAQHQESDTRKLLVSHTSSFTLSENDFNLTGHGLFPPRSTQDSLHQIRMPPPSDMTVWDDLMLRPLTYDLGFSSLRSPHGMARRDDRRGRIVFRTYLPRMGTVGIPQ